MCLTPTCSIIPTLNIFFISRQGREGGNDERHESPGNIRHDGSGYFGGHDGDDWDDYPNHGVREITVASGDCIDSIRVAYDRDGELVNDRKHGGDGGKVQKITLQYPNEFLVSVSGTYGIVPSIHSLLLIRSLQFRSNRKTYELFGSNEGTHFSFEVRDGKQIVSMKGRSGNYLDAICFYIAHAPKRTFFCRVKESLKEAFASFNCSIVQ